jgi:hypothetical protein
MEQDLFSEIVELHFYKITLLKLKVHATRPAKRGNSGLREQTCHC